MGSCLCHDGSMAHADGSAAHADAAPPSFMAPKFNHGGALDVIVVRQHDGSLHSTDWHVIFNSLEKAATVSVSINGHELDTGAHRLHASGQLDAAHFVSPAVDAGLAALSAAPPREVLQALRSCGVLLMGRNQICYTAGVGSGRVSVRAFLYLWDAANPAVIFDVDGTVTLNDIAGQAAMLIDHSPTHPGLCETLCQLHARGYLIIYLTSRPLLGPVGIEKTRRFLFEVAVDASSGYRMPQARAHDPHRRLQARHLRRWHCRTCSLALVLSRPALCRLRSAPPVDRAGRSPPPPPRGHG